MPQQQDYIWDIEYQGYVFKVQSPTKPKDTDIHQLYVNHLMQTEGAPEKIPAIDIGDLETDEARAKRNAEEVGSFEPDKIYRDAKFWDRFGEQFKLGAAPHFGLMERTIEPADEPWEMFADALGGISGAALEFWGIGKVMGGVGTPLKAGNFLKKLDKYNDLMKQARAAKKAGDAARASKYANEAKHVQLANPKLWRDAVVNKNLVQRVGLLGKSNIYHDGIVKIAANRPKLARAANLFVSNAAAFGAFGQTKLLPWEKFENRASQMGKDLQASLMFSIAGLPTPLGLTGKSIKYGVEPTLIFGAGMYSDLGREAMTWEERVINGSTFLAFHLVRQGMSKSNIKEHIATAFRLTDPTLSEAHLRSIKDGKAVEAVIETARGYVEKNPKYMTFVDRADATHSVEFLRVEKPTTKQGQPKVIYRDLSNDKVSSLTQSSFYKKFSKNEIPKRERVVGRELTKEETDRVGKLESMDTSLREALESPRYGKPFPLTKSDVELVLKNPFKKKVGVKQVDYWGKRIDDITNKIDNLKAEYDTVLQKENWPETHPTLEKKLQDLESERKSANIGLREAYKQVHEREDVNFDPASDKFEIGDHVKIPVFDASTQSLDYTKSGIGKYIGTMKDFKSGEVIAPSWMQKEPTRYTNYFKNVPVFSVKINKGTETVKVAIGGKVPEKVSDIINSANMAERPLLEYAETSPRIKEIAENPVIKEGHYWNKDSKLFDELFVKKSATSTVKDRVEVSFSREVDLPRPLSLQAELSRKLGFKDTPVSKGVDDFQAVGRDVRKHKRWWEATEGERGAARARAGRIRLPGKHPAAGARARKAAEDRIPTAPWNAERFFSIWKSAQQLGFKGSPKELYEFFDTYSLTYKGTVEDTYHSYAPSRLKRIKLSDGSKPFPDGVPTPEGAMRMEADRVAKVAKSLEGQRAAERSKFAQFKGANAEDWPDMNKMPKEMSVNKKAFESYPEFDPLNEKPIGAYLMWDARVKNKIVPKRASFQVKGSSARFKTREEASDYIADHWVNAEAVEKLIKNNVNEIASIKGKEYKAHRGQQIQLKKAQDDAGISDSDYRTILREFWPESKGTSKNMTMQELEAATKIFKQPGVTKSYNDVLSSILPPANVMFSTKPKLRKLLLAAQKLNLPTYTVNMFQDSKIAFKWARRQMHFERKRENNAGFFADYLHHFERDFGLKHTGNMKEVTTFVDRLFEDFYNPKMDKYPVDDMTASHKRMTDYVLAEMLLKHGVEARNASNPKMGHEPLFEVYNAVGEKIELANQYDAIRISKGIEFIDSNLQTKRPPGIEKAYMKSGKVRAEILENTFAKSYIEQLRRLDEATGKYDNGWFIIDKERYVPQWKDGEIVGIERIPKNTVENTDGKYVKIYDSKGNPGKYSSHIVDEFLTRSITKEFKDRFVDPMFNAELVDYLVKLDPEFVKMAAKASVKRAEARKRINNMSQFLSNSGSVYGTIYSRVGKYPPVFALEKGTNKIIHIKRFKDVDGKTIKKGSKVIDINGVKKEIGEIIQVYERDYNKLMSMYAQRIAHISATYEIFGRGGANNVKIKGDEKTIGEIDMLAKETSPEFARWAHEVLELQVNSAKRAKDWEKAVATGTSGTAQVILSTPKAGVKNALLGTQSTATVFGFRATFNGLSRTLRAPREMSGIARKAGAHVAGVHELVSGRGYAKYNTGFMRPTEIGNRTLSIATGKPFLSDLINVLNGIKTPTTIGMSKDTAMDILSNVYKFRDKHIKDMYELGADRLHERPEYIQQAIDMSHIITQGAPNIPFVPHWMGKRWAKPLTLFYRIAYRMVENVGNSVIKPLATRGNPVPLMRYLTLLPLSGAGLAFSYYLILDRDVRNRFKNSAGQYWDLIMRAEWLAVFNSAFDEHGSIIDSYWPAVFGVAESIYTNIGFGLTGKKYWPHAIDDMTRDIVLGYDDLRTIYENLNAPNVKKYNESKRRQRQFSEVYFRDEGFGADEADLLTVRSPSYRLMREAFWGDDEVAKARTYWAAINFVINEDLGKDISKQKKKFKSRKLAKKNTKQIISDQRPIPTSWRKLDTGTKTRYDLFWSQLTPKQRAAELEIEKIYQEKVRAFNRAVQKYADEFSFGAYDDKD